jgi:hypothetical protein
VKVQEKKKKEKGTGKATLNFFIFGGTTWGLEFTRYLFYYLTTLKLKKKKKKYTHISSKYWKNGLRFYTMGPIPVPEVVFEYVVVVH